jgi:rare lipoprotein A
MHLSFKLPILLFISVIVFSSFSSFLPSEIGNAIIIDDALQGKKMACELKYDKLQNVAAHKTLPCGTKIKVTVLATNKSIELTIVDNAPYLKGQLIAISSNAAKVLGINNETRVKVETLDVNKIVENKYSCEKEQRFRFLIIIHDKSLIYNIISNIDLINTNGLFILYNI